LALGDAIAHRGNAARELGNGACLATSILDQSGIGLERLMSREHVIIGRDDRDIRPFSTLQRILVVDVTGSKAMGEVAAGKRTALWTFVGSLSDAVEIGWSRSGTALGDALGNLDQTWMHRRSQGVEPVSTLTRSLLYQIS